MGGACSTATKKSCVGNMSSEGFIPNYYVVSITVERFIYSPKRAAFLLSFSNYCIACFCILSSNVSDSNKI